MILNDYNKEVKSAATNSIKILS
ncbi:uncharacterized protein METZ01_LOCUS167187 [marine metagenome]|uniref:Uncharacterized protein n=1 Tax=marine metagenome TaxID=408172 RepID=A0A382BMJ9_9ZZZZ